MGNLISPADTIRINSAIDTARGTGARASWLSRVKGAHSYSIVPGGFEVMSYTTRLTAGTSFTMRFAGEEIPSAALRTGSGEAGPVHGHGVFGAASAVNGRRRWRTSPSSGRCRRGRAFPA